MKDLIEQLVDMKWKKLTEKVALMPDGTEICNVSKDDVKNIIYEVIEELHLNF